MDGSTQFQYPMLAWTYGCFGDGAVAAPKSADEPAVRGGKGAALVDEIHQLSDAVRRALECPVCKELSGAISTCCDNGHGLCDECSYTMNRLNPETPPKCPLCRSPPARLEEDACSPQPPASSQPTDETASDHQSHSPRPTVAVRPLPPPESARKLHEFMSIVKVSCIYRPFGCRYLVYVISAATHESLCPYSPNIRCMVPYCRWSGAYGDMFHHVASEHQFSAYDVMENQFLMPDLTFGLQGSMRRTYLTRNVHDDNMLYWVCVARTTARSTVAGIQVAVLKVYDPDAPTKHGEGPPDMVFRVRTMSQQGWQRQRGRSRSVCWDRMVLDRMTRVMASGGYREKYITTLHTPPWCTVTVRNNLHYEAVITWNSVVR
ncbi:uncharacterized protein LOC100570156 [Acyrthosiphon pisum]|uniref:Uncharacterized protein n=1 Tax=Acyrthosiphon pisum TaxID=7029 RepID=A0A8R1W8J6_ACYPI|nr:uncharacterized protein LOC100570156 [Acyrthosiphon pisum]|eukprot:XP_003244880.1 PREDICTED: uncharacterized protein LOC100570156 [Acyrthosiphon pisum]